MLNLKQYLAEVACKTNLTKIVRVGTKIALMPYLRSVNYHATPNGTRERFIEHLLYYKKNYKNFNEHLLCKFFDSDLKSSFPGLIIGFDDGYADNYDVAASELDKEKMKGWFYIIVGKIGKRDKHGKSYMTWEQIRDLKQRGHVIGSHSWSHRRLGIIKEEDLEKEIIDSKKMLEDKLSIEVNSFCFPFGDDKAYSAKSIQLARDNYNYIFTSCPSFVQKREERSNIGRTHVESSWKTSSVEFVTSGLIDWKYHKRRDKYERAKKVGYM